MVIECMLKRVNEGIAEYGYTGLRNERGWNN